MFYQSLFHGDLSTWDMSNVQDMSGMFLYATSFNGDISKWDVSRVTDMSYMFSHQRSFDGDISKWNVSSVTKMECMFMFALSFNGEISKWDVSSVVTMTDMFQGAASFKQTLCGHAWVNSKADKEGMFTDSSGSISRTVCMSAPAVFSSRSKKALAMAVALCLELSPKGYCSNGQHGPIGEWDVSRVADMSNLFSYQVLFNGNISKWVVSNVQDMSGMFHYATSFNGDISK